MGSSLAVDITANATALRVELAKAQADLRAFTDEVKGNANAMRGAADTTKGMWLQNLTESSKAMNEAKGRVTELRGALGELGHGGGEAMEGVRVASAGVTREIIVLGHEMLQGNFSRIPGSIMVLGERVGGVSLGMVGWAAAIGAVTYAVYELVSAWVATQTAVRDAMGQQALNLTLTKDTEAQTRSWITSLKDLAVGNSEAKQLAVIIASIGGAAATSRDPLAKMAIGIAAIGDKDVVKVTEEVAKAANGGAESFLKWAGGLNLIRAEQEPYLKAQVASGSATEAFNAIITTITKNIGDQVTTIPLATKALSDYRMMAMALGAMGETISPEDLGMRQPTREEVRPQPTPTPVNTDAEAETRTVAKVNEQLQKQLDIYGQIATVQQAQERATANLAQAQESGDAGGVEKETRAVANATEAQDTLWRKLAATHTDAEKVAHDSVMAGYASEILEARDNVDEILRLRKLQAVEIDHYTGGEVVASAAASDAITRAEQSAADKRLQITLTELAGKEAVLRNERVRDFAAEVAIEDQKLAAIAAVHGTMNAQYIAEENNKNGILLAQAKLLRTQQDQIARDDAKTGIELSRLQIQTQRNDLEADLVNRRASAEQVAAMRRQLVERLYQIDLQALQAEAALRAQEPVVANQINNEILLLRQKHNEDMAVIDRQYAQQSRREASESARGWKDAFGEISSASSSMISQLMGGQVTFKQAAINTGVQLLEHEIQNDAKALLAHIFYSNAELAADKSIGQGGMVFHALMEMFKTNATIEGAGVRSATAVEEAAVGRAASAEAGSKSIMNDAYKAAAGAYASAADIPYVGWLLAPIAAAGAFAAVAAFDVLTAEGGAWEIPGTMPAIVHAKESVLPASVAGPMRDFFLRGGSEGRPAASTTGEAGGGGGDSYNITIQAIDTQTGVQFLRNNMRTIVTGLKSQVRNGTPLPSSS